MHRILKAISTPTAKTSAIFYIGNFTNSIFRYLFHLVLLRFLAPAEYGEFLSYLSLIYLLSIPMTTIATVITKYVSEFKGKEDKVSINLFFHHILHTFTPIAFLLSLLLVLFSGPLAILFKAQAPVFVILGISVFISLFQTTLNSYLIAFQKFIFQTVLGLFGVVITILISIALIKVGFGATGAVIGQILGGIIPSIIIFLKLKSVLVPKAVVKNAPHISFTSFMGYSFLFALGTMSLISTDILVVRIIFDPHSSGIYSSLSILGRIILFGLLPLVGLVLPIASHRHAATGSAKSIFIKLGAVITLFGLIGAGIFSTFPELIVRMLSGPAYLEVAEYLPLFAFTMVFFAPSQFITSFLMATGKPKATLLLIAASVIQPLAFVLTGLAISHIVMVNFFLHACLLTSLIITYFHLSHRD